MLADVKWLASSTKTFSNLDCTTLGPWLTMARDFPKQTSKAIHKICLETQAVQAAVALVARPGEASVPAASAEMCLCRYCDYVGSWAQVHCHEQREHGEISVLTKCVDTCSCAICGLSFEAIVFNRLHSRASPLCKINLLRYGPVMSDAEVQLSLDEDATFKTANSKSGKSGMKKSGCCVSKSGCSSGSSILSSSSS